MTKKVMLAVDRLDIVRHLPIRLMAYEKFLKRNPFLIDKVVLIQLVIPTGSKSDKLEFKKIKGEINNMIERIHVMAVKSPNKKYRQTSDRPGLKEFLESNQSIILGEERIRYYPEYSSDFNELHGLYLMADIVLITSWENAKDGLACQNAHDKRSVLVLSEVPGAVRSAGALVVRPWDYKEMVAAMNEAFHMSDTEREDRHKDNVEHLTRL